MIAGTPRQAVGDRGNARPSSRRLRIAQVTATFPPYHGGTGNVAYHNARELARLGHDVHVFTATYPDAGRRSSYDGVTVHRLASPFRFGNAPFLPSLLRLPRFDLVHLHYPFYFGGEMIAVRWLLTGQPYVVTYHQDVIFAGPLRYPEQIHDRLVGRRILQAARRVYATSSDYARASRLRVLLNASPATLDVLPNGVDGNRFTPTADGSMWRGRYGLLPADRVVLFVGALDRAHYFKGVRVLLESLARLREPRVKLLVVGAGDLLTTYRAQATELGVAEQVIFCGYVPDHALPGHYAASDVVVLPSTTMGEAFGVVLLEAMATARPVVASRLPGVRTVVVEEQTGLLAEPGDVGDLAAKLRTLLADPTRARAMGLAGRALVERQYDWAQIGTRIEGLYRDALGLADADTDHASDTSARGSISAPSTMMPHA